MGARRWGRARGTSRSRSTVQARAAARSRSSSARLRARCALPHRPSPPDRGDPGGGPAGPRGPRIPCSARSSSRRSGADAVGDTHTWDGGAGPDDQNWSTPLNWADDSLPGNGDDLVFPDGYSIALNDDFLTSVGSVDIGQSVYVWGSAVTVAGLLFGRAAEDWGCTWDVPTTLRDDTTIGTVPTGNPTGAPFAMSQDISLEDGAGDGHTLTVDTVDCEPGRTVRPSVGSGALVKLGTGDAADGLRRRAQRTARGTARRTCRPAPSSIMAPGALSSHTDVQIADDGTVAAELWDSSDGIPGATRSPGAACSSAVYGHLTLTAASDAFTGTAQCGSWASLTQTGSFPALTEVWGTLRGTGTVGALEVGPLPTGAGTPAAP